MVCGAVRLEHPAARNLIRALPASIVVGAGAPGAEWIQSTLRLLAAEAGHPRPGGETVITRLADIIVIQALRAWIESDPGARTGWLGALRDPLIGKAIALVHDDPARDWTVAALATELAMSRSAFAARFTELVGEPAMRYVTSWRMHVALAALQDGGTTIAQLADQLGYRSEAAFARAFKRVIGTSPGAVRRRRRPRPGTRGMTDAAPRTPAGRSPATSRSCGSRRATASRCLPHGARFGPLVAERELRVLGHLVRGPRRREDHRRADLVDALELAHELIDLLGDLRADRAGGVVSVYVTWTLPPSSSMP